MDVEESFSVAGNFGRFQFLTSIILHLTNVVFGTQMLLMVIVGANPDKNIPSEANLTTIVTEWQLQEELWIIDLMGSLLMAGYIAGMVTMGQLPDLYGRKPLIIITFISMLGCTLGASFCRDWQSFAVTRFLGGMCIGAVSPTTYVLLCELIGKKHWGTISLIHSMYFSIGIVLLALLGYTVQDWRIICRIISLAPLSLLPLLIFVLPESPRWLYSVGKIERAEKIMNQIAKRNGKGNLYIQLANHAENEQELRKYTIIDLCRVGSLLKVMLMCCFIWFACCLVYYGLTLNISDLAPNLYTAIVMSGTVEIPSFLLILAIINRKFFGRKGSILLSFLLCGSAMTALVFLDAREVTMSTAKTVLGLVAKLPIAGVFAVLFLYTAELFPTQLRVVAVGGCSICARFGAIISPFIPLLANYAPFLPYVVFALLPLLAATTVLFLPETLGREIPKMPEIGRSTRKDINCSKKRRYGTFGDVDEKQLLDGVNENNAVTDAVVTF